MTDLTVPPVARRFAALLDREYCFWMPSPSVALLSALVTSKERPKRLLVPEDVPAFVSNVGKVAGAAALSLAPADIDDALRALVGADGLSPGQIWGVALHRAGKLSPTDWLASCAAAKVPTIELCLGSLASLAQWGSFPATFTIVDLDAEASFAGVRLTALLTNDRGLAARVQHLCLPGPEAHDYILDANPRGLAQDEPDLLSIVEDATALFGGKPGAQGAASGGVASLWRRLRSAGSDAGAAGSEVSGGSPLPRWSARLAEAEARHAELLRSASAFADSLKARLEQQTASATEWERRCLEAEDTAAAQAATIGRWESRFNEAEAEAEKDAAVLSRVRDEAARQKAESERVLASMKAEHAALEEDFTRTKEAHLVALRNAAASEQRIATELGQRILALEAAGAAAVDREVKEAQAAESMRARLQAQVDRLESEAAAFTTERAGLLTSLASLKGEREALEQTLARAKDEHLRASRDAAASEQRLAVELRQRIQELEDAATAAAGRESERAQTAGSERSGLQGALASMKTEREALERRIARTEQEHVLALRNAAAAEMRITIELRQRIKELEAAASASADREARQQAERETLEKKLARTEADHLLASKNASASEMRISLELRQRIKELEGATAAFGTERARLLTAKEDAERARAASEDEKKALARKLVDLDAELGEALAEAARLSADQRGNLEEQGRRASKLEAEVAALAARGAENTTLRSRLAEAEKEGARLATESVERERALRSEVEAQRLRVEELEGLKAREAARKAEGESTQAGLAEQVRRLEGDAALVQEAFARFRDEKKTVDRALAQARADIQAASDKVAAAEAARDLALNNAKGREEAHRAEVREIERRADVVRREAASAAERDSKQAEAREASRADLAMQIARLEAAAVAAEKARAELLNRKLDMERALAAAESQVAVLTSSLAAPKLEPVASPRVVEPPPSADQEKGEKPASTGGFSSLLKVLQTSVIERPSRGVAEEKPPQPQLNQPFEYEANADEAPTHSSPASAPVGEPPIGLPEAADGPRTGGFSALLDRLTGRTRKPRPGPPADESEKLGGWLRDRKQGKD